MEISKLMFAGIIIFTSAGTAALDLIFPPAIGIETQIATVSWCFFTVIGAAMMLVAWVRKI